MSISKECSLNSPASSCSISGGSSFALIGFISGSTNKLVGVGVLHSFWGDAGINRACGGGIGIDCSGLNLNTLLGMSFFGVGF